MKNRYMVPSVAASIKALSLDGFGGKCYEAAKIINRKVFNDQGRIVGVVNAFWAKRYRFLGHVAVQYNRYYWDSRGQPMLWDDLQEWGMVDPKDPDYFASGWNEDAANKTIRLDEAGIEALLDMEKYLNEST